MLSDLLNRRLKQQNNLHVPIIGTKGVGKTSFIISLSYLLNMRRWAEVIQGRDYVTSLYPIVWAGKPIPPTNRPPTPIILQVEADEQGRLPSLVHLSTGDISGQQFEDAMSLVSRGGLDGAADYATGAMGTLFQTLQGADGLLVLLDITTYKNESDPVEMIMKSLADQIVSICNGIEYCLKSGKRLKFVFFIFNKQDKHGIEIDRLRRYLEDLLAMIIHTLRNRNVEVDWKVCSSVGWDGPDAPNRLDKLAGLGLDKIFVDVINSLGLRHGHIVAHPIQIWDSSDESDLLASDGDLPRRGTFGLLGGRKRARAIAYAILKMEVLLVKRYGAAVPPKEVWLRLRELYPRADVSMADVSKAIDELKKDVKGPVSVEPHTGDLLFRRSQDDQRLLAEIRNRGGEISRNSWMDVADKLEWNWERVENVLRSLERSNFVAYKDGKWKIELTEA